MTIIEDIPNEVLEKILAASCDLNYGDLVLAGQVSVGSQSVITS